MNLDFTRIVLADSFILSSARLTICIALSHPRCVGA